MSIDFILLVIVKSIAFALLVRYWKTLPIAYKLVILPAALSLVVEVVGRYIALVLQQSNVWIFNIYALIQMLLLGTAGYLFADRKVLKQVILSLMITCTLFWIWYAVYIDIRTLFNWFFVTSSLAVVVTYILVIIDKALFRGQKIFTQPLFLISISYIIFSASVIPLFGVMNMLINTNMDVARSLFTINRVANILCFALITIAFYLYCKQEMRGYVRQ
ncbi:MAG: hypothetical protein KDC07_09280 [Chitinophagaceae bacterium]|nr:hypothetical protein [Chitinophagaceae bacterium]MCB9047286.1 hypothetical protein [Chitinophagales bacterium]